MVLVHRGLREPITLADQAQRILSLMGTATAARLGAIYIRFPVHTVVLYNTSTTPNKQKALAKWDLMD